MRSPRRTAGPALVLVLTAAGLVGSSGAVAGAAESCTSTASVVVHLPDASVQTVSGSALCNEADVFNTQYFTRSVPGRAHEQASPVVADGTSIHELLEALAPALDPSAVSFVAIPRPNGTWTTLDPADLADPSDFADNLLPVLVVNGDLINYYRPLYPGRQDVNSGDAVTSPEDGSLAVDVHSGTLLTVSADVDRSTASPGQVVRFAANVSGTPDSSRPLSYAWTFGDGETATGANVTHAFTADGTYDAQLTVTGSDDSGGVSNQIAVTIGAAPPKGGHRRHGSGASHQPDAPSSGPRSSTGTRAGARPSQHASRGHAGTGQRSDSAATAPPSRAGQPPTSTTMTPAPSRDRLPMVQGRLIGPGTVLSASGTSATRAATAVAAGAGVRRRVGTGAGVVAVLLTLLGLGAVRERRGWPASRRRHTTRGAPS